MKKILVAVDGSDNAKKAISKAREIGELAGSEIHLLYVVSCFRNCHPYVVDHAYEAEINRVLLEQGKKILEESLDVFEGYSGKVKNSVLSGDVAKEIIEYAENNQCDLIVMGSRGLNTFSRAMLGSISNKVLNHAEKSILIVR
ncbi:MAG: universal stress protein [Tissierellaceae bacterium]|nr:universal stress protein [Tissierellaceae bacterium]